MEYTVQTTLRKDELIAALKKACPADSWMFLPAEGKITFLFYCRKETMYLHPVLWVRNTMRKDLYLVLEENENGSIVHIFPRYTPFFRVFSIFWFSLLFIFMLMAIIAGQWVVLIPLGAILLAAVVLLLILRKFARNEEEAINAEAVNLLTSLK